jgi:hypothetical protein
MVDPLPCRSVWTLSTVPRVAIAPQDRFPLASEGMLMDRSIIGDSLRQPATLLLAVLTCALLTAAPRTAAALNVARALNRITNVADDVPVRRLDDVLQHVPTRQAGRELLERMNRGRKFVDPADYRRALQSAWRNFLPNDGALRQSIDEFPIEAQQAALVMARGGQTVRRTLPDLQLRSQFVREGGADLLATIGRYDDMADDAFSFRTALKAGNLPSPPGTRNLELQDLGRFFQEHGDRAHTFWSKYVRPHWKLWLGGGALAAVLLTPDEYLDEVGNLTAAGIQKITRFAGNTLGRALSGAVGGAVDAGGEAARSVVRAVGESVYRQFLSDPLGIVTAVVLLLGLLLLIPFTRRPLIGLLKRPFQRSGRVADSPMRPSE